MAGQVVRSNVEGAADKRCEAIDKLRSFSSESRHHKSRGE